MIHHWGEAYRADQLGPAAAWQRSLGAEWSTREVFQRRCASAVRLPSPRPIIATRACRAEEIAPLVRRLAGHDGTLRYAAEMNRRWHGTAAYFVSRWRRVYRLAHRYGVTVAWTVSGGGCSTGDAWRFWPGRSYVDAVGWSEFGWATRHSWQRVADACYPRMRAANRPIVLPEIGVTRELPMAKRVAWLRSSRAWCETHHVRTVVYLDARIGVEAVDWRLAGEAKTAWGAWGRAWTS